MTGPNTFRWISELSFELMAVSHWGQSSLDCASWTYKGSGVLFVISSEIRNGNLSSTCILSCCQVFPVYM